jgi:hypothetical protein
VRPSKSALPYCLNYPWLYPGGSAKAKPLAFREAAASHFRGLSLEPPLSIWRLSGYGLAPATPGIAYWHFTTAAAGSRDDSVRLP